MLATLVVGTMTALPFSLDQPRWHRRPTISGVRGAIAGVQLLLLVLAGPTLGRGIDQLREAEVRDAFHDREIVHVVFYKRGAGGDPISHCKAIFRYTFDVTIDAKRATRTFEAWLEDDECGAFPTNQWIHTNAWLHGYWTSANEMMSGIYTCAGWPLDHTLDCEVKLIPQETT